MAQDFLLTYAPLANDIAQRTGLDPSVVLGIVDTETGGGTRVAGNNVFGISPVDKSGRQYVEKYPDVETAAEAFVTLMQTPRYRAIAAAGGPAQQAAALVKAGYNTVNPRYAEIVANKATRYGQILGYQDEGQGGQPGAAQPVAAAAAAPAPDYNNPPARSAAPVAPVVAAPAGTGSAVDRVLADPALSGAPAATPAPAAAGAKPQTAVDRVLADPALQAPATAAPAAPPAAPDKGGIARNVAAGVLEGVGGTGNALANPSGAIGQLPATAIVFLHDALAPVFGYERFPDKARNMLLGNELNAQPGTTAINALGAGINTVIPGGGSAIPSDVEAKTEAEKYARVGATGATMGAMMSPAAIPASLGAIMGAAGGAGATAAGEQVPEWMRPMTEIVAGGVAGAAALPVAMGARALQQGVNRFANGPAPGAAGPPLTQAQQVQRNVQIAMSRTPGSGGGGGGGMPPPGGEGPQPGMGPRSAGAAATPGYEAIHTPAEEAAYRANAEGKKLLEPQIIGEPDNNMYIPGETVDSAAREQTAKAARELKELGIRVPEASDVQKAAEQSNDTARTIYTENTAKSQVDIQNRTARREADINADKVKVFAEDNVKGPVDFEPVIRRMEEVLNDPFNRQNSDLRAAYQPLLERIRAAGIEDPREAWSLIRDIDKMTGKRARSEDRHLHEVAHDLNEVSKLIGDQVDLVAPGFGNMRARYAEHSRAIDEMTVLQGALKNLRGPGQKLTYNDFQRFMKNVVDSRMTGPTDLNAFKSITEENMQRLWNIRDSLRRVASAKELARAAGSDTMPNIIDALKGIAKMGGTGALHAYAGAHLGPAGNFALQGLTAIGKGLNDRRTTRRTVQQMNRLLYPTEPLRLPPGQENPLAPP